MKYICIIAVLLLLESCGESVICDEYRKYYEPEIKGLIIKKYKQDEGGRLVGHIIIINYNKESINLSHVDGYDAYDEISVGDSIAKDSSSLVFKIFRNDDSINVMNICPDCSYVRVKSHDK